MKRATKTKKNAPAKKKIRPAESAPSKVESENDKSESSENEEEEEVYKDDGILLNDSDVKSWEAKQSYLLDDSELENLNAKYSMRSSKVVQNKLVRLFQRQKVPETVDEGDESLLASDNDFPSTVSDLEKCFQLPKVVSENWLKLSQTIKTGVVDSAVYFKLCEALQQQASVYYSDQNYLQQSSEIRLAYCARILNHLLKSRAVLQRNDQKIKLSENSNEEVNDVKDRGLVQPKVLILSPFRSKAFEIVNTLISLLQNNKKMEVAFKKRFKEDFGSSEEDAEKMEKKPEDYRMLFSGHTDEHFRIGITLAQGKMRLYSQFYKSDIIIASPLGLRTAIGEIGEAHYEYDFLSSIEIFVLDHADVFMMQNWEHVLHIMKHLHLQPKDSHDVDFSRVFDYCLDGHSKHYCQNLVFTSVDLPSISTLQTKYCSNRNGLVSFNDSKLEGSVCGVIKQLPLGFHRLNTFQLKFSDVPDTRFKFFLDYISKAQQQPGTLVYIPQYYDFVRIKNHMRRQVKSAAGPAFGYISEYSDSKTVGKARRNFLIQKFPILLYSERYHFYHRPNIKGIKHIVFYDLPTHPHFFSELCNMMSGADVNMSVSAIYSKFDSKKLDHVVGTARARNLLQSNKSFFMLVTGKS
uniref:digestive organ expansion factor homolog n=1 Tax=Ciona intestinalis TaxID=7719 RepID=UPI000180B49F|nr:digestive organ expansion factor homolog [Ciona intestinalis]|eukprot:XP_002127793.1 digestive organ expansion factor homolog [Ciona intestinalis]